MSRKSNTTVIGRICSMCLVDKPKSEFHKSSKSIDGRNCYCKECNKLHAAKYKSKNKEIIYAKERKFREENPAQRLLWAAKHRAKKNGLEFSLELSDIIIPEYCPLIGIKIDYRVGVGRHRANPSLDRIDNSRGYIKGNVEVMSDLGNRMKSDASVGELVHMAHVILERYFYEDTLLRR